MIDLYAAHTPNGWRAAIGLAEADLAYRVHLVDLDHKSPAFLAVAPLGAIPVMVDGSLVLSQSGVILLHVAERCGQFIPSDPARRAIALQWMMFACSDVAAASGLIYMLGHDFENARPKEIDLAEARMLELFRHADRRLTARAGWTNEAR